MVTLLVVSLMLTSLVGMICILHITDISEDALLGTTLENMDNLADSKAELADAELGRFADVAVRLAEYIGGLYDHPERYIPREVPSAAETAGELTLQRGFLHKGIQLEDVRQEMELLSNVEQVFLPVMLDPSQRVFSVYLATESGFFLLYDARTDLKKNPEDDENYYDFRASNWYSGAMGTDAAAFTSVYPDNFGSGLMITCAAAFYDAESRPAGVVGMDIHISELYEEVVGLEAWEGMTAFLVDEKGVMISPDAAGLPISTDPDVDAGVEQMLLNRKEGRVLSSTGVYFSCQPMRIVPWTLAVRVEREVIMKPIHEIDRSIRRANLISLAGFAVLLAVVVLLSRRFSSSLTEPLVALSSDVRKISGGNLDYRATVQTNDEIGDLANEFNGMATSLKDHIENLTRVTAERERIGAELNVAARIQADMLPSVFPPFPQRHEFEICAAMTPAKEMGGDFYDFFLVDDDHIALVMADVSGKGVPAALFMVMARTLIQNRVLMGDSPAQALTRVNDQLCENNKAELFVTVWLAVIQLSTGQGLAVNAGHEHPVIRRAGGQHELVVYRHAPPVASLPGLRFREHAFELRPGDQLFVYTDGVTEATDAQHQLFGTGRMLQALNNPAAESPEQQLSAVRRAIDRFVGEAPQFDDITMMSLHYRGQEEQNT